jgi:hypothetical protein
MLWLKVTILFGLSLSLEAASYLWQGFEDVSHLSDWVIVNNSTPGGQTPEGWFQGTGIFTAASGPSNSYIQANFENAGDPGDISTWLLSPMLTFLPGATLHFSTIGENVAGFPDRLELRLSTSGASTNVGSSPSSIGDFSQLLLSINPSLADAGYPTTWTEFQYTFSSLSAPTDGRFAFRYFVPDRSINASTIGVDSVFIVPEATSVALTGFAIAFLGLLHILRRRFYI